MLFIAEFHCIRIRVKTCIKLLTKSSADFISSVMEKEVVCFAFNSSNMRLQSTWSVDCDHALLTFTSPSYETDLPPQKSSEIIAITFKFVTILMYLRAQDMCT